MENITVKIQDVLDYTQTGTVKKAQSNEFCTLAILTDSDSSYSVGGNTVRAEMGDMVFIPAGLEYSHTAKKEHVIEVQFDLVEYNRFDIKVFSTDNHNYIEYFERMLSTWQGKKVGYYFKTMVLFYAILGFMEADDFSFKDSALADKIRKYIEDSFNDGSFTVTNVAEKFNVSEVYIRRVFKERFAMTPKEYLQRLRIDYACKLLSYGCISISEVAAKSGFNDEKYFSAAFKKDVGQSPSSFAKGKK